MPKRVAICAIWALIGLFPALAEPAGKPLSQKETAEKAVPFEPHPAVWKVSDADTTLYLFGTTHVLPAGFQWQSEALRQIIATADALVVESLEDAEGQHKTEGVVDESLNPVVENRPILTRVSTAKKGALQRAILRTDFPVQFYDAMPTWMASLVLAVEDMAKDGKQQSSGVEAVLLDAFQKSHRPIYGIEDGSAVLTKMRGLSDAAQTKMLEDTLDDIDGTPTNAPAQGDIAWAKGETASFESAFRREDLGDELYTLLILDRNRAWTDWLKARMDRPGTLLFAAGAGHFAGPDSVLNLLKASGLTVTRLD